MPAAPVKFVLAGRVEHDYDEVEDDDFVGGGYSDVRSAITTRVLDDGWGENVSCLFMHSERR